MAGARLRLKRVYAPAAPGDGERILVDGLWPRGLSREAAALDLWAREVAPSAALRSWFGHDPARWSEFRQRYLAELRAGPERVEPILRRAARGPVTLLFAARDQRHNHAVALRGHLARRLRGRPPPPGGVVG